MLKTFVFNITSLKYLSINSALQDKIFGFMYLKNIFCV